MSERSAVLIGPARSDWFGALHHVLRCSWRVDRSLDRASFRHDLGHTRAHHVILCDLDRDGIRNAPLLAYCAGQSSIASVILVHERAVVRLPSSWSVADLAIEHVMLGRRSLNAASLEVAAILRREKHRARSSATVSRHSAAFPVA